MEMLPAKFMGMKRMKNESKDSRQMKEPEPSSGPQLPTWTLDFENQPQEACETVMMLSIVFPGLPSDALSGNVLISITEIPEIINRYEYSYHPKKR